MAKRNAYKVRKFNSKSIRLRSKKNNNTELSHSRCNYLQNDDNISIHWSIFEKIFDYLDEETDRVNFAKMRILNENIGFAYDDMKKRKSYNTKVKTLDTRTNHLFSESFCQEIGGQKGTFLWRYSGNHLSKFSNITKLILIYTEVQSSLTFGYLSALTNAMQSPQLNTFHLIRNQIQINFRLLEFLNRHIQNLIYEETIVGSNKDDHEHNCYKSCPESDCQLLQIVRDIPFSDMLKRTSSIKSITLKNIHLTKDIMCGMRYLNNLIEMKLINVSQLHMLGDIQHSWPNLECLNICKNHQFSCVTDDNVIELMMNNFASLKKLKRLHISCSKRLPDLEKLGLLYNKLWKVTIHMETSNCTPEIITALAVLIMERNFQKIVIITSPKYEQEDNLVEINNIKRKVYGMNMAIQSLRKKQKQRRTEGGSFADEICSNYEDIQTKQISRESKQTYIEYFHHYADPQNVPDGYNFSRVECYC